MPLITDITTALVSIEAIVSELPRIGKRSELRIRADEILRLTAIVRKLAAEIERNKEMEKYTISPANHSHRFTGKE